MRKGNRIRVRDAVNPRPNRPAGTILAANKDGVVVRHDQPTTVYGQPLDTFFWLYQEVEPLVRIA